MSSTRDAERLAAAPTLNARGVSLRAVTDASRRLDELSTARVVGEAADAIHKAQKSGQSVGGVSPDAIVILPTGEVTLDLPSGKTVGYSPPERLRGSTGDRRSDVFSLGVVLWEALAHERLFGGATDEAIKSAVLDREYRPLAQLNANVPAELDAICKKALARDPADRYQSAKVMAAEISAVLDDAGYPESNEEIAKYIAAEFPAGALPKPPVVAAAAPRGKSPSGQSGRVGATTNLGMPALREPAPVTIPPIAKPSAPAPSASGSTPTRDRTPTPAPSSNLPSWATQRPAEPPPSPTTTLLGTGSLPATPKISPAVLGPIPGGTLPAAPGARDSAASAGEAPAISAGSTNPDPGETRPTGATEATLAGGEPGATSSKVAQPSVGAKTAVTGSRADADAAKPPPRPASIASSDTLPAAAVSAEVPPARPALEPANAKTVPAAGSLPAAEDDFAEPRDETPNPADVVALPPLKARGDQTKGDMLGGWGWGTDSHQAIDDGAYDDGERTSKRRLLLAVGGAGAAALLITVLAFAFSGGKSDKKSEPAAQKAATWEAPAASGTSPEAHNASGSVAAATTEPGAAAPNEPTEPAQGTTSPSATPTSVAAAEPSPTEPTSAPAEIAATSGSAISGRPDVAAAEKSPTSDTAGESSRSARAAMAAVEPPKAEPSEPKADPSRAEPPKAEPRKAEPPKTEPTKAPKSEPAKIAAAPVKPQATKEATKPAPTKHEATKADATASTVKPQPTKAPAKADKRVARAEPATARPIDPYTTPEPKKVDPSAALKTGLQQFARGDSNGALATFKASLAANPSFAPTWRGIGLVYEKLGKKSQARIAFQKYLQLSPTAGDAGQIRERLERLP